MEKFIETLKSWSGAVKGDARHKQIVDAYNRFLPHPRGYKLTVKDDFCAATVSAAAILCGLTDVIPIECSCKKQIEEYQRRGQWEENENRIPNVGDQVFYYWGDGANYAKTDCKSDPQHTGIVVSVGNGDFVVFEGNKGSSHCCGYRTLKVNGQYIRGFGCPAYPAENKVLVRGNKGETVKKLQEFLNACGCDLVVDGSFGDLTNKAFAKYVAEYIKKVAIG